MVKKKERKKTTKLNVNPKTIQKVLKCIFICVLILLFTITIVKIEEDLLYPFGIDEPDLNFQFFTSSECIRFHPLYIKLDGQQRKIDVSTTFDKIDDCVEKNFIIDVSISDGKKYTFKINDRIINNKNGNILLDNSDLQRFSNSFSVDIHGLKDYYNYYKFKSEKSKIQEIEFNIANRFLCEGECIGIRNGNVIDANNINGRSVTYKINDSEVKLIFLPKIKFWNYSIIFLHSLIAGLFLLLLEKLIFGFNE